ncbi:MAG: hypothetical protein Q8M71_03205 [Thermodesulfovibrionales bacterium]|nr:hypothetical protein [Thermodesulfovibrionales bacterium]
MQEQRQHKRVTVEGVYGSVLFASKAEITNISLGGVAIQVDANLKIISSDTGSSLSVLAECS